jgi:hypothetical protein
MGGFVGLEEINVNCENMAYIEILDRDFTDMLCMTKGTTFISNHTNSVVVASIFFDMTKPVLLNTTLTKTFKRCS